MKKRTIIIMQVIEVILLTFAVGYYCYNRGAKERESYLLHNAWLNSFENGEANSVTDELSGAYTDGYLDGYYDGMLDREFDSDYGNPYWLVSHKD